MSGGQASGMTRQVRRIVKWGLLLGVLVYLGIYATIAVQAYTFIAQPLPDAQSSANPTVLVLGNRALLNGKPNPCLTGRVDKGLEVLRALKGSHLLVSGGMDLEDRQFESQVMADHAASAGFKGTVVQERQSTSTYENLQFSAPLLQAAGRTTVVIVTEPYHLWRTRLMVQSQGLDKQFEVHYAAAQTSCWQSWGMLYRGSLREPLAVGKSLLQGYL
jgi:uncharacterized SAM-binding protein YcdF (DUF218 family)